MWETTYLQHGYFLSIESRGSRVLAASSFGVNYNNSVPSLCRMPYGCFQKPSEHGSNFSGWLLRFKNSEEKPPCGKHSQYPQTMEIAFESSSSRPLRASIARSTRRSKLRTETSACCRSDFKRLKLKTSLLLCSVRRRVKSYLQQVGSDNQ